MTPERWQRIDQLLDDALELEPCERAGFLDKACASDGELRAEIESLLAASELSGKFIESPFLFTADLKDDDSISLAGQSLGPYRLLREIGRGGMGVVYLADRDDDEFKKQVAIKLVQPGPHNKDLLRRFRRERQILASLDHPNIARLYDGGTTEQGMPYLVMEHITGTPITEYCDERKLSIGDRLKLYRDVCAAVQHAHQSFVIHRDLKPSNILVTADGEVKLLDFGIAKLLDADSAYVAFDMTTGVPVMTPEYASPEQIRGQPVTTASDVYSLGVVLYELLTGHYPYRFKDRSLPEIIRVICEQEPEPPSRAINRIETKAERNEKPQTTVSAETVSRTREGKPEKLRARLRGDVSEIALMTLRKDPRHRYGTVGQLSEDIRRHLEGQVVLARKATLAYRASKFIRRYKTGAAVAMILTLTLLGGVLATLRQASIARQEARDKRRTLYAAEMKLAAQAWDTTNIVRLRELIEKQVPRDGEEDLRGFEWRYLWRLYNHNGQLFRLQDDIDVWTVDYSPDGRMVATGDDAGRLILWDVLTGQRLATLQAHEEYIWALKFSPDGKLIATAGGDKTVKLWDTATWQEVATLRGHDKRISVIAFSADGKRLVSGSDDNTAKVWDVASRRNLNTIYNIDWVRNLAFSPDGKELVLRDTNIQLIVFLDAVTGETLRNSINIDGWPAMFSPDGRTLALLYGRSVKLVDVAAGQVKATFDSHSSEIRSVAFSPDSKLLATGSDDRTTKIWDIASGAVLANLKGHEGGIWSVAFSPDGKTLATGSDDFTCRLWDITVALEFTHIRLNGHVSSLSLAPDGKTIASCIRSSYRYQLWDARNGNQLAEIMDLKNIRNAIFSPDGSKLALTYGKSLLKLLDAATLRELISVEEAHNQYVASMSFSPDGHTLATASEDHTAKLWDTDTGRLVFTITEADCLSAVAFSPDGKLLATSCLDRTEKLWDAATGRELAIIRGHIKPVMSLVFSPDGKTLAMGGADGTVKFWDVATRTETATLTGNAGHVNSVAFSPDGTRLATGSDEGSVRLWDVATGQEVITFSGHTDKVTVVVFSPDGDTLVSSSADGTIRFWRAASREEAFTQR